MMVLNREEGLECEIRVVEMQLEHVLKFKYLGCALDASGADEVHCRRKATSRMRVGDAFSSLVNAWGLQLECASILHKALLVSVLMYGSETMI